MDMGDFVKHSHNSRPYIPATSLKGTIRSLAEVVGNTLPCHFQIFLLTAITLSGHVPTRQGIYSSTYCSQNVRLHGAMTGNVFAGLIHFSDAEIIGEPIPPNQWPTYKVAVGQPKRSHTAFYPENNQRKFYHHQPGATQLTGPHAGITQTNRRTTCSPWYAF